MNKVVIILFVLFQVSILTKGFSQCDGSDSDSCSEAISVGLISTPTCEDVVEGKRAEGCLHNANPESGLSGCTEFNTNGTVWFQASYDVHAYGVEVNVNTGGDWEPRMAVFKGGDCSNLELLSEGCSTASGLPNKINAKINQPIPGVGGTVWVAVTYNATTVNENANLEFSIDVAFVRECQDCTGKDGSCYLGSAEIMSRNIRPTIEYPLFCPGEEVRVCIDYEYDASQTDLDWLQGIMPRFGPGWDLSGFDPEMAEISMPGATWIEWDDPNCAPLAVRSFPLVRSYINSAGDVSFFHSVCEDSIEGSSAIVAGSPMPSGWFWLTDTMANGCDASSCSPNNHWGMADSYGPVYFKICFDLKVKTDFTSSCMEERSLDIAILPTTDVLTGCWPVTVPCVRDDILIYATDWKIDCSEQAPVVATGDMELCSHDTTNIQLRVDTNHTIQIYAIPSTSIERRGSLVSSDSANPSLSDDSLFVISERLQNTTPSIQYQRYVVSSESGSFQCEKSYDTLEIRVLPQLQIAPAEYEVCKVGCAQIYPSVTGGSLPYSFAWDNGQTDSLHIVCPEVFTTYTLSIVDGMGCTARQEYPVKVKGVGQVRIIDEDSLWIENINLKDSESTDTYVQLGYHASDIYAEVEWIAHGELKIVPDVDTPTICRFDVLGAGVGTRHLSVIATDTFGCSTVDTIAVHIGSCGMLPRVDKYVCDDKGTTDTSDDEYFLYLIVNGPGDTWSSEIPSVSGAYNEPVRFGPFIRNDEVHEITLIDSDDVTCKTTFYIRAPKTCSTSFTPQSEIDALISFYDSTDGDNWKNNTGWKNRGLTSEPCEDWYGVHCDSLSRVIRIFLSQNNLRGKIPKNIKQLTQLRSLDLYGNDLVGGIPVELGQLSSLEKLSLSANKFSGTIPDTLWSLDQLTHLTLDRNQLTGEIPAGISSLKKLVGLSLASNSLVGEIPEEIGDLVRLKVLSLQENQLSGSIPASLGQLSDLESLILHDNKLTGSIPAELGNYTKLFSMLLFNNNLSGCLDPALQSLCGESIKNFSRNPLLPWQGDFEAYCQTDGSLSMQEGAPCDDGVAENGTMDRIIDCVCTATVSTEERVEEHMTIFPNPTRNRIYVKGERLESYRLIDIYGRTVDSGIYTERGIDVSDRPQGVYILELYNGRNWIGRKVQVLR